MDKKKSARGGKKQKIFLVAGLFLAIAVLSGCGEKKDDKKADAPSSSETSQKADSTSTNPAVDNSVAKDSSLPKTVSSQPGSTPEEEVKNIDKDLGSMNDADLSNGLSDSDLGL